MKSDAMQTLMYHELLTTGRSSRLSEPSYLRYTIDSAVFGEHLSEFSRLGLTSWIPSVDELSSSASRRVHISFDDGCSSDIEIAAPLLAKHGFFASFFVSPGLLGETGYMSKANVVELASLGHNIGTHGLRHERLSALPSARCRQVLLESKSVLEELLGQEVISLSCPEGAWSGAVARLAIEVGYRLVYTSFGGSAFGPEPLTRLGRIPVLRGNAARIVGDWSISGEPRGRAFSRDFRFFVRRLAPSGVYSRIRSGLLDRAL